MRAVLYIKSGRAVFYSTANNTAKDKSAVPKEDEWWTEYDEVGLSHARTTGRETLL
jgi:hypothetical protein